MYKILGGDQKEYGPVTAGQLQEWIQQRRVNPQTMVCVDGTTEWKPLSSFPEFFSAPVSAPPMSMPTPGPIERDNPISTVVPYKNPKALFAYYLGIFSLIPCIAIPLGISAFILGVLGLQFLKTHPNARGKVHAWIGIVLGGFCALANIVGAIAMFVGVWR